MEKYILKAKRNTEFEDDKLIKDVIEIRMYTNDNSLAEIIKVRKVDVPALIVLLENFK